MRTLVILWISLTICACAAKEAWNSESDESRYRIESIDQLSLIERRWNEKQVKTYHARFRHATWIAVSIIDVRVKDGLLKKATIKYPPSFGNRSEDLVKSEVSKYMMTQLIQFAYDNLSGKEFEFYTNKANDLIVAYSWSDQSDPDNDDRYSVSLEEIVW